MFPWKSLVFASVLSAIAASCDAAARCLSEPVIVNGVDASSIADSLANSPGPLDLPALTANVPPGLNLTEIAEKLPPETRAKLAKKVTESGNSTELAALAAAKGIGPSELAALLSTNGTGTPDSANATGIPDSANATGMPDLSAFSEIKIPDLSEFHMPPLPSPSFHLFGYNFDLSSLLGVRS